MDLGEILLILDQDWMDMDAIYSSHVYENQDYGAG